ncbi:MAG: hypothetical protein ABR941_10635 [Thermoleophilia bacterium]|jgi:hypothetical protein
MSKKLLAGIVAVVVLALAVWLVPTAFGTSGTTSAASGTTVAASSTPAPHTGCTHAPATTSPQ